MQIVAFQDSIPNIEALFSKILATQPTSKQRNHRQAGSTSEFSTNFTLSKKGKLNQVTPSVMSLNSQNDCLPVNTNAVYTV
jgi:hypothetical protein